MMNTQIGLLYYVLLFSNALLVAAGALAIIRLQRLSMRNQSFWASPTGATLSMQMDSGELLDAIDRRIASLEGNIQQLDEAESRDVAGSQGLPYENAVRMARHGAKVDDLTRTCGLSASEAKLLMRVHSQQSMARAS